MLLNRSEEFSVALFVFGNILLTYCCELHSTSETIQSTVLAKIAYLAFCTADQAVAPP